MNNPIFLDTGYILALLNSRDEFHFSKSLFSMARRLPSRLREK
uniref:Uncharacterized protein n=1 Tax=Candidatus Kentrum sp. LFY TaxID=2126342 RepID=A0A450WTG6_9GAMM|nr:MAG: hypothetical protein BECKLFY1418C_GA0070996_107021 [Candidatus Kentron sp. LFY]